MIINYDFRRKFLKRKVVIKINVEKVNILFSSINAIATKGTKI